MHSNPYMSSDDNRFSGIPPSDDKKNDKYTSVPYIAEEEKEEDETEQDE